MDRGGAVPDPRNSPGRSQTRAVPPLVSPMSDHESRMGLVPVESLLAERDELVRQVAPLRARYATWGTWEHERKIELAKIATLLRQAATDARAKVSAAQVDDMAHADLRYIQFVADATIERAAWINLEARIEGIDFTLQRGQAVARFLASETYLTPRTG